MRRFYVGGQEASFGAGGSLTHLGLSLLDGPPIKRTVNKLTDAKYTGGTVRTDQATGHIITDYALDATVPVMPSLEIFAWALGKILGNDTKAAVGGLWGHTITCPDVGDYLPSFPVEEHLAGPTAQADTDWKHLGVQLDALTLTWGEAGMAKLALKIAGSGSVEAAGTVTESGLVVPDNNFIFPQRIRPWFKAATTEHASAWDGTHEVSATAGDFPTINTGATNLGPYCIGGELRLVAGLGQPKQGQYVPSSTSGIHRSQQKANARVFELDLTLRIDDSTRPLIKALEASTSTDQNEYTVGFEIAGFTAGHGMQVVLCLCDPPNDTPNTGEGMATRKFTFIARKVKAGTDRPIVSAYAVNADNIDYGTI
jgi:hypothetical protein